MGYIMEPEEESNISDKGLAEIKQGEEIYDLALLANESDSNFKFNKKWVKAKNDLITACTTPTWNNELSNYAINLTTYYENRIEQVNELIKQKGNSINKNIDADATIQQQQYDELSTRLTTSEFLKDSLTDGQKKA